MILEIDILWCEIFRYAKKNSENWNKKFYVPVMFQLCSS